MAGFEIEVSPKKRRGMLVVNGKNEEQMNKTKIIDWLSNRIENYCDGLTTVDEVSDNIILASRYLADIRKKMGQA